MNINPDKLDKQIKAYNILRDKTLRDIDWGGVAAKQAAEKVKELSCQIEILEVIYRCLE